jgi:hypothetical protein
VDLRYLIDNRNAILTCGSVTTALLVAGFMFLVMIVVL